MKLESLAARPQMLPRGSHGAPVSGGLDRFVSSAGSALAQNRPRPPFLKASEHYLRASEVECQSQATGELPGPLRSGQEAVESVHRFNGELHLAPEVLARRNEIMVSSPAKFFRVNPSLFYDDVTGVYFLMSNLLDREAPSIVIAGDCHLGNLGTLRAADGSVFWGINDFDMAGRGSPEDDLERMATSLILMSQGGPLSPADQTRLVGDLAHAYLKELSRLAEKGPSPLPGLSSDEARGEVSGLIRDRSRVGQEHLLNKFAEAGWERLQRNQELRDISSTERELVDRFLGDYDRTQGPTPELKRPVRVLDVARKAESGGSTYGLNRYYLLLEGSQGPPRILELKQELPTAPEQATGDLEAADAAHIFSCMSRLGGTYDPTMAFGTLDGDAYYVRERQCQKASLEVSDFTSLQQWQDLVDQAAIALARAHGHQPGVARAVCNWVGSDEAVLVQRLQCFAQVYAQQTVQDCAAFAASL